ncbi:hypothetical protein R75461_06984 [Paraburkholderia nemoris]|uniref:Wzt carbohydrate-binding domain-containing protein n=1 Tax=Paraburkholderia nemoris TaxID=2793076 RepID=UPI00190B93EB|nr:MULTISPECIES: Wzt carbohydrate-binding domain-containing protein [Paraburkholderia]MBK3785588.1 sulfotransferase family 2 domain-containing protein [Paraburkholderia aspalathi]CAE6840120.1 hypothetical protein R75461_06984 [Paraburkholderia nemoris]
MRFFDGAFPGRIIFDHLPKTAGQAVNAWLTQVLGPGCVSPNLYGDHRDLIRRQGGLYSIISGHVHFQNSEQLDPRYQYMTCFREPVDRAISWIFYVLNDAGVARDTIPLKEGARQFLASEGWQSSAEFLESITNPYTEHFCRIFGDGSECDDLKVANALAAIQQYDVVGVYETMPQFLADVAALIGIPAPHELARVNVTSVRRAVDQVTPVLRERIVALNQLDLRLYSEVVAWKAPTAREASTRPTSLTVPKWARYEPKMDRVVTTPDITISAAILCEGYDIRHGQPMTFDIDFALTREVMDLEMGIHLFDSDRRWAFGINSTLLGQTHQSLPSGEYRVTHNLIAHLPAGKYTAGFAFAERLSDEVKELAWHDVMCEFQVFHQVKQAFAGYSYLPAEIHLRPIESEADRGGSDEGFHRFRGSDRRLYTQIGERKGHEIVCTGQPGYLTFGPYISLAAGCYGIVIRGTAGEGGVAGAHVDIAVDKGERILAGCPLGEPDAEGCFVILPVLLDSPCSDLEVRVWVTDTSDLQISLIEIESCQTGELSHVSSDDSHMDKQEEVSMDQGVWDQVSSQ